MYLHHHKSEQTLVALMCFVLQVSPARSLSVGQSALRRHTQLQPLPWHWLTRLSGSAQSTTDKTSSSSETEQLKNEIASQSGRVSVELPEIKWTVHGHVRGWQDENGKWFDKDGPRNGPPLNYWRQRLDERNYAQDIDAASSVLKCFEVENVIDDLERRKTVNRPSLNRKLLGRWAPLMRCGQKVAYDDAPVDDDSPVQVPLTVDIFRAAGRRLAEKTVYGVFDKHLTDGELLAFLPSDGSVHVVCASGDNEPRSLGNTEDGHPMYYGKITYLSDYLLVSRGPGREIDLWLRADDSYLGLN